MKTSAFLFSFLALSSLALAEVKPNLAITPLQRPEPHAQARHDAFNEIAKKGEAQIVFLGDSITQGWEKNGKAAWEAHFAGLKSVNFGIGADRTEHVIWRLQNGNFEGIKPKLVVLMIGTNNTGHQGRDGYISPAENTAEGVKKILDLLKEKAPQAKVLLLGIFPRGETPEDKYRKQNEVTNALIAKFADNQRVFFKDIGKAFLKEDGTLTREIMPDLLHLSPAGYEIWAKEIKADVERLSK